MTVGPRVAWGLDGLGTLGSGWLQLDLIIRLCLIMIHGLIWVIALDYSLIVMLSYYSASAGLSSLAGPGFIMFHPWFNWKDLVSTNHESDLAPSMNVAPACLSPYNIHYYTFILWIYLFFIHTYTHTWCSLISPIFCHLELACFPNFKVFCWAEA